MPVVDSPPVCFNETPLSPPEQSADDVCWLIMCVSEFYKSCVFYEPTKMQAQSIFSSWGHLQLRCKVYPAMNTGSILKILWNLARVPLALGLGTALQLQFSARPRPAAREELGIALHITAWAHVLDASLAMSLAALVRSFRDLSERVRGPAVDLCDSLPLPMPQTISLCSG